MLAITIAFAVLAPVTYFAGLYAKPADIFSFTYSELGGLLDITILDAAPLAGDSISQDYGRQGLFTLTQPVGRTRIMLSRTLAIFTAATAISFAYLAVAFISSDIL